jgi:hypothetical protein
MSGKASEIVDAIALRMTQLGFEESNASFDIERIPATSRDKSFMVTFETAVPDNNRDNFNKKFNLERVASIKVLYAMTPTLSGRGIKNTLLDAYDKEEEIISSLLKMRVSNHILFETVDSIDTAPLNDDSGEWLLQTILLRMSYTVDLN